MTRTTPLQAPPHLEVKTLAVDVLEGPDSGQSHDANSEIFTIGTAQGNDLVLNDRAVSGYHLELTCRDGAVEVTDLGSTNGTRFSGARIQKAVLPLDSNLRLGRTVLRLRSGEAALVPIHSDGGLRELVGNSPIMRRLMAQVDRVARSEVPTLLMGESGTGKEVVARAIHALGVRATKAFVTVDCGAFSPNLVASELFGHERGAFAGADRQRIGAFERADGGTLFLDEVGELPLALQPQLLGALERRRFRRLGGQDEIQVDVQVLSATNRDIRQEVNNSAFRLDLYFRLAVVVLRLPPLREHREDIPLLVEHFLREAGHDGETTKIVSPEAIAQLADHRWPGNVRELRNWVEATVAMGDMLEMPLTARADMPIPNGSSLGTPAVRPYKDARRDVVDAFEASYLGNLLEACGGNVSKAARQARMDRSYLIKLLQRHQLR